MNAKDLIRNPKLEEQARTCVWKVWRGRAWGTCNGKCEGTDPYCPNHMRSSRRKPRVTPRTQSSRTEAQDTLPWEQVRELIRPGDPVTILIPAGMGRNGQEWREATGRAVMRSQGGGWVLNMGGRYGRPGVCGETNFVRVRIPKNRTPIRGVDRGPRAEAVELNGAEQTIVSELAKDAYYAALSGGASKDAAMQAANDAKAAYVPWAQQLAQKQQQLRDNFSADRALVRPIEVRQTRGIFSSGFPPTTPEWNKFQGDRRKLKVERMQLRREIADLRRRLGVS